MKHFYLSHSSMQKHRAVDFIQQEETATQPNDDYYLEKS